MASVSVYICPGANQSVDVTGAPICTAGAGSWQQVDLAEPFDPSQLDSTQLAEAFGAGWTVMGTCLVIAFCARKVYDAIGG